MVTKILLDWWFWVSLIGVGLWISPWVRRRWRDRQSRSEAVHPDDARARTPGETRPHPASVSTRLLVAAVAAVAGAGVGRIWLRPVAPPERPPCQAPSAVSTPVPAAGPAFAGPVPAPSATMAETHEALMDQHRALNVRLDELVVALNDSGTSASPASVTVLVNALVHHRLAMRPHLVDGMEPQFPYLFGHEDMPMPPATGAGSDGVQSVEQSSPRSPATWKGGVSAEPPAELVLERTPRRRP